MPGYSPNNVCSKYITFTVEGNLVKGVSFIGGCSGNLQGIGRLVENMPVMEVVQRLQGIKCGNKDTSCPDQLAKALKIYLGQTD